MPGKSKQPQIPLPKSWGTHVKSAILHVVALAQYALTYSRSRAADSSNERARFMEWYNQWRPHTFLNCRTPNEAYHHQHPACRYPRFEPRSRWPRGAPCTAPRVPVGGKSGVRLKLDVACHAEQTHLPIVKLRRAA